MKINDKNLAAFATSATPVDREGWLHKRGEVNKGFQRRWFVLKGNLLFYFEKPGDKEPLGVVVLEGCTIGKEFHFGEFSKIVIRIKVNIQRFFQNWQKMKNISYLKLFFMEQGIEVIYSGQTVKNQWNSG